MSTSKTLVGILVALFIGFAIGLFGKLGIEPVSCPVESVTANYGDSFWTIDSQIGCKGGLNKQDRISQIIKLNGGQDQIRQGQLVILPTK